jgi:hypothetical protein
MSIMPTVFAPPISLSLLSRVSLSVLYAVYADGNALSQSLSRHRAGESRRFFGGYSHFKNFIVHRLVSGILKVKPLVRKVPDVFVL